MNLRAGQRLHSAVSDAQLIVVRAPDADVDVRSSGGAPLLDEVRTPETAAAADESSDETLLMGKRYADDELGLELLCTRPGDGALTVDGKSIGLKGAKPLPSSD